jgi:hypothetical protein
MEILLNLVWVLLAIVIVRLWLRDVPREGASRRTQIAALAMLILILFPVISVTDDLQAAQNLAEDDTYLRRDPTVSQHSIYPEVALLPRSTFTEFSFVYLWIKAPGHLPALTVHNPALTAIHNRPPPAA